MRIRTSTCTSLVSVIAVAVAAGLSGCADTQKAHTGPVPEGYDSWEDYSRAQDEMQMEVERAHRQNPPSTGVPR